MEMDEEDLYEILSIQRDASKVEIKKAYRKAALSSHPDKHSEENREDAEARFKAVQRAYDILQDDQKRHLYDTHGMAAFSGRPGGSAGATMDVNDILAQMFGMGVGGEGGMHGMPGMGRRRPAKGRNEEQEYEVTLEEMFKGKTTRFTSTKNVICGTCEGSGGRDKAKPQKCGNCEGQGQVLNIRHTPFGLMQEPGICPNCEGRGTLFKEKDKCKKCKGKRVIQTRKMLELYIPRGSREGDRIVLQGEADQVPDQEPGDIIFALRETAHPIFKRAGSDLAAEIEVTLAEALTGFSRVVLTHLDGRGIQISPPKGKILRPNQVLRVQGEGMPKKKSDQRGDLFLLVNIQFPADGSLEASNAVEGLRALLPKPSAPIQAKEIEEVEYQVGASMDDFGSGSGDPRAGDGWQDDDDEDSDNDNGPQCATQ